MRNTLSYLSAAVILVVAGVGVVFNVAYADRQVMVTICHFTSSETNPWVEITAAYPAIYGPAGHFSEPGSPNAGHENDFEGPCEVTVTEEPTNVPPTATPTPTNPPQPTPTPTDEGQPTPTPTDEDCGGECDPTEVPTPTPTDPPTLEPTPTATELPKTGDGLSPDAWLCWGENVWCSHNGVEGSEGELWVFLYPGATVAFRGQLYTVESIERVTPDMVQSLDDAVNYDIALVTCSNYIGGVWVNRVIVFANLREGGLR